MKKFLKVCWIIYGCLFLLITLYGGNIFLAIACALWEWPILVLLLFFTVLEAIIGKTDKKTAAKQNHKAPCSRTTYTRPYQPDCVPASEANDGNPWESVHKVETTPAKINPAVITKPLQQVTCPCCGSKEFEEKDDCYICEYCGSLLI